MSLRFITNSEKNIVAFPFDYLFVFSLYIYNIYDNCEKGKKMSDLKFTEEEAEIIEQEAEKLNVVNAEGVSVQTMSQEEFN
jgi:hypothetical protein